jgi:hypothetical protein
LIHAITNQKVFEILLSFLFDAEIKFSQNSLPQRNLEDINQIYLEFIQAFFTISFQRNSLIASCFFLKNLKSQI